MNVNQQHPRNNLGWSNDDPSLYERLRECKAEGHATGDRNLDMTHHGYDRLYYCDTCGYEFHEDSSD